MEASQCDADFTRQDQNMNGPQLDDKSQRVETVDFDALGLGGERRKLTLRPPEEYDIEDTKEITVDDLAVAEVLKLAQNEGGWIQLQLKWACGTFSESIKH